MELDAVLPVVLLVVECVDEEDAVTEVAGSRRIDNSSLATLETAYADNKVDTIQTSLHVLAAVLQAISTAQKGEAAVVATLIDHSNAQPYMFSYVEAVELISTHQRSSFPLQK